MGEREHAHQVLAGGEVEVGGETRSLGRVLLPLDAPAAGGGEQTVDRQALGTQGVELAGASKGRPPVRPPRNAFSRPCWPRGGATGSPSSSDPRCTSPGRRAARATPRRDGVSEQPTIPAPGTKAASIPSAPALARVSASKPSTSRRRSFRRFGLDSSVCCSFPGGQRQDERLAARLLDRHASDDLLHR